MFAESRENGFSCFFSPTAVCVHCSYWLEARNVQTGEASANKLMMTYRSPRVAHNHLYWWTRVGNSGPPTWWLKNPPRSDYLWRCGESREQVKVIQTEPARTILPLPCESCSTPVIPKVWHQPWQPRLPHSSRANVDLWSVATGSPERLRGPALKDDVSRSDWLNLRT